MSVVEWVFQNEAEKAAHTQAVDHIKNRFGHQYIGHQYITKANALMRVEGNTHFLERNG